MTDQPLTLQAAFARALQAGFSHALLLVDRGAVPPYALLRVTDWEVLPQSPHDRRGEMVALYHLRDATAPRWCLNPSVLKNLTADFARAVAHLDPAPEGTARVAVIVAKPMSQKDA